MPEGHDATIEVCNIMSFVLYTQILKQSVLKPASPGITLNNIYNLLLVVLTFNYQRCDKTVIFTLAYIVSHVQLTAVWNNVTSLLVIHYLLHNTYQSISHV